MKKNIHYCFVDEAGDLTLFNKRGVNVVGKEGVSRYFFVGVASVSDPRVAENRVTKLRQKLLADNYFSGVPSMQPNAKKTALYFHAKDDLPEVRREVYAMIKEMGVKVQVVVRRKDFLITYAKELKAQGGRISAREIYSSMISRLFKNMLHKADENRIVFAHRQNWTKAEALECAIRRAKKNFELKQGVENDKPTSITSAHPSDYAGLQIVDYYLWALQRFYEKGESRYFEYLKNDFRLIMDIDDRRNNDYGEWYSDSNPLTIQKVKNPQMD